VLSEIICTLVHGFLDVVITKAMKKGAALCLTPLFIFLGQQWKKYIKNNYQKAQGGFSYPHTLSMIYL
jgi:hypothetical protein